MLLFFLSNNLFFFHLLGNFLYVVCCILWETVADDVILDFLCAYLAHHIVCASNCWIIYNSIMLIFNKEIIDTVFSWREIDFGEVRSITLVVFLSLSKECIVVAVIFELVDALYVTNECQLFIIGLSHMKAGLKCKGFISLVIWYSVLFSPTFLLFFKYLFKPFSTPFTFPRK